MTQGFAYVSTTVTGQAGALITLLDNILNVADVTDGWEKVYTATNRAVYRPRYGVRGYIDIDDTGADAGGAREARIRGYESMTAVGTGTDPFPTIAQRSLATYQFRKSNTADATARAVRAIRTSRCALIWVQSNATTPAGSDGTEIYLMGDWPSLYTSDSYNFGLFARALTNNGSNVLFPAVGSSFALGAGGGNAGHWMRNAPGTTKSMFLNPMNPIGGSMFGAQAYPSRNDRTILDQLLLSDKSAGSDNDARAILPCLYGTPYSINLGLNVFDTITVGARNFVMINGGSALFGLQINDTNELL